MSTDHVQQNKAFWWDAFSRELSRSGVSPDQQKSEIEQLKVMTPEKIEACLCQRFGPAVLRPYGDIDRPFTPRELGQFALNPWVHVGNHTRDCAILTNCTPAEMVDQITACQDALAVLLPSPIPTATARMLPCRRPRQPGCVWASPWRRAGPPAASAGQQLPHVARPILFYGGQNIRRQCRLLGARFVPSHTLKTMMQSA